MFLLLLRGRAKGQAEFSVCVGFSTLELSDHVITWLGDQGLQGSKARSHLQSNLVGKVVKLIL